MSAMKPEDVPDEWVQIAAKASYERSFGASWARVDEDDKDAWLLDTRYALAAVIPLVRAPSAAYAAGAEAMREAAAGVADAFPARTHGALATAPYAAAEQAAEEIAAAIRSLPLPASAWQPIETAPRDGTRALFYAPAAEDRAAVWRIDYWWVQMRAWAHMRPSQPYTHWMPLAEAPE